VGLLFAAGSALIFVLGFPTLWYFVAFAVALGIGIATFLSLISQRRSDRHNPLSILAVPETPLAPVTQKRDPQNKFHLVPKPISA
jgi:hypothetical protein